MRNDKPQPLRCAVCDRTGPLSFFTREGEIINWVEAPLGTVYVVCRDHIDSVYVQDDQFGLPIFAATPNVRDIERRLDGIVDDMRRLVDSVKSLQRRCDFYDNNGPWNES